MVGANDEPQTGTGIEASYEKHAWWASIATVHGVDIEGPFAGNGDDDFVARFKMVVTIEGQRSQMSEVGVYTMVKGKIVKEAFLDLVSQLWGARLKIVFVLRYRVSPLIPRLRGNDRV